MKYIMARHSTLKRRPWPHPHVSCVQWYIFATNDPWVTKVTKGCDPFDFKMPTHDREGHHACTCVCVCVCVCVVCVCVCGVCGVCVCGVCVCACV